MDQKPPQPGTAVLDILVERHRALLERRGESATREQALGRLLASYLRFRRERILAAFADALAEATAPDSDPSLDTLTDPSHAAAS